MNKLKLTLMIVATLLIGCDDTHWEENVEVNGIAFTKFSREKMRGALAEDATIQGYPCKKGFLVLHDNETLKQFRFSQPYEFSGFTIPANTWAKLDKEGIVTTCFFSQDVEIQGILCRGSRMGLEGITTSFHKNGKLRHCFPRHNIEIDGIPCKGSVFHITSLHDNGTLSRATLSQSTTINGIDYKKGTEIKLDKSGNVLQESPR